MAPKSEVGPDVSPPAHRHDRAFTVRGSCGRCRSEPVRIIGVSGSILEALVEEELGSVVFVMDYVQLDFSAARFSAYVWPTVTIGDATLHFGDRGYRDALCAFITHEVLSTEESPDVGLVIRFGLGSRTNRLGCS